MNMVNDINVKNGAPNLQMYTKEKGAHEHLRQKELQAALLLITQAGAKNTKEGELGKRESKTAQRHRYRQPEGMKLETFTEDARNGADRKT